MDLLSKDIIGILAAVILFISYGPYLYGLIKGRVKPHIFTWGIWGLMMSISFFAQISDGAGAGAWVTGLGALITLSIALIGYLKHIENLHDITKLDTFSILSCFLVLPIWYFTGSALVAAVSVAAIDAIAYIPTFRKGYRQPYKESIPTYLIGSVSFYLSVMALGKYSVITMAYPMTFATMNLLLCIFLLWRRSVTDRPSIS